MDGSLKKIQLWDPVNEKWVNAIVDTDGYLRVSAAFDGLKASDLNIDEEGDLQVDVKSQTEKDRQLYGYDGAAWQKLSLLFGYSDRLAEFHEEDISVDQDYSISMSVVPSGYIYIIKSISFVFWENSGSIAELSISLFSGDIYHYIKQVLTPSSGVFYIMDCDFVLKYGDSINIFLFTVVSGIVADISIWGYKMKIS